MSPSFLRLWENMQGAQAPLDDTGLDSHAMAVIRTGDALRGRKDNGNFWDDFVRVCNDSEGLSQLLGVRPQEVQSWSSKVKEARRQVERAAAQDTDKNTVLPTGGGAPSPEPPDALPT